MGKDLRTWIEHIEEVRPAMDALARNLRLYGAKVEPEETHLVGSLPYIAEFQFGDVVTTITFLLKDHQTDSDVVVTDMTTLPEKECGRGYGSQAIQALLRWTADSGLAEVRATQVGSGENERFWRKNGFVRCPDPNPYNDFVFTRAT